MGILIHTSKFLPYSETFIKNHIESFAKSNVIILTSEKLADGLLVATDRMFVLKDGRFGIFNDALFKLGLLPLKLKRFLRTTDVNIIRSYFGQMNMHRFVLPNF
jgi:colanic acid/amylovoran biosynthesis glycosyltransferase